jgi:3-deoxy-D-arabino-heptulosonate 7-phosphate (DAHP) synthase
MKYIIGSCSRMDPQDAMEKAKRLKAEALGAGDFKDETR